MSAMGPAERIDNVTGKRLQGLQIVVMVTSLKLNASEFASSNAVQSKVATYVRFCMAGWPME